MRNVDDYLVTGAVPDGHHVMKRQDADDVYELRVALDRTTWRISFRKPGGQVIILLTVFRKTRQGVQKADVDRAVRTKMYLVRFGEIEGALQRATGGVRVAERVAGDGPRPPRSGRRRPAGQGPTRTRS